MEWKVAHREKPNLNFVSYNTIESCIWVVPVLCSTSSTIFSTIRKRLSPEAKRHKYRYDTININILRARARGKNHFKV